MIRERIWHILKNYNKKPTIYDYIHEPERISKKEGFYRVEYVARPIFNRVKEDKNRKNTNSFGGFRKFKQEKIGRKIKKGGKS